VTTVLRGTVRLTAPTKQARSRVVKPLKRLRTRRRRSGPATGHCARAQTSSSPRIEPAAAWGPE
jgi:hypothetical protein